MADDEKLALPSLGFGRGFGRGRRGRDQADAAPSSSPDTGSEIGPEIGSEISSDVGAEPETARLAPVPEHDPAPRALVTDEVAAAPGPAPDAGEVHADGPQEPEATPRRRTGPLLDGAVASPLVGLVVGALVVVLTAGALRGCEAIQGTTSCGNPGFFLLLAVLVLASVVGSALLRLLGVSDPGSTSGLGVGLMAVVALLFLVDVLFEQWMIIAIPVVTMLTFALSRWVATAFEDTPT